MHLVIIVDMARISFHSSHNKHMSAYRAIAKGAGRSVGKHMDDQVLLDRAFDGFTELPVKGAVDCDVHPAVPGTGALLKYMDDHWREQIVERGIDGLDAMSFPPGIGALGREDWRLPAGKPGSDPDRTIKDVLDGFDLSFAILNCLYHVQGAYDENMSIGLARAVNNWVKAEWLDRDPRFRASIVIPTESPELAVDEIDRLASDKRFVQIMMLAGGEIPMGRRFHWPIFRAAEKHGLPITVHAGTNYRHAPTSIGWPSFFVEEYVGHPHMFQMQLLSLITEGVFTKFPNLKFVFAESGFTWLPPSIWRANKTWKAMRVETPWVDRPPAEIVRSNFRFTLQPSDIALDGTGLAKTIEHIGSDDVILFSTDYPHAHFEGKRALPPGLSDSQIRKICIDNPLATYPRLKEASR